MTANELADYLENNVEAIFMSHQKYIDEATIILREQQAEIEQLKALVISLSPNANLIYTRNKK